MPSFKKIFRHMFSKKQKFPGVVISLPPEESIYQLPEEWTGSKARDFALIEELEGRAGLRKFLRRRGFEKREYRVNLPGLYPNPDWHGDCLGKWKYNMEDDKISWYCGPRHLEFENGWNDRYRFDMKNPHASRRTEMLKKYPEIKRLMGYNPIIALIVGVEVLVQIFACWLLQDVSWVFLFVFSYCFGTAINLSLGAAIHEIGHNLVFGHHRPFWNKLLLLWCNLPIFFPFAVSFSQHHINHHRYLGDDTKDINAPLYIERILFRNPLTKLIWLVINPFLFGIRAAMKPPNPVTKWEFANNVSQFTFNTIILFLFGLKPFVYLFCSSTVFIGINPLGGGIISDHPQLVSEQATRSYYGPLNVFLFNSGYHNEHHDFPNIPSNRLPEVKKIAAEYYKDLPCNTSYVKVIWDFLFDQYPDIRPTARTL